MYNMCRAKVERLAGKTVNPTNGKLRSISSIFLILNGQTQYSIVYAEYGHLQLRANETLDLVVGEGKQTSSVEKDGQVLLMAAAGQDYDGHNGGDGYSGGGAGSGSFDQGRNGGSDGSDGEDYDSSHKGGKGSGLDVGALNMTRFVLTPGKAGTHDYYLFVCLFDGLDDLDRYLDTCFRLPWSALVYFDLPWSACIERLKCSKAISGWDWVWVWDWMEISVDTDSKSTALRC